MQRKHLLSVILALSVSACVNGPDLGNPSLAVGDVCAALAEIKWSANDPDHISDKLALSLDRVLEMEQEHGCT